MARDIGGKLKTLRKGRGLTQFQLADKVGLSRCTISNYETGRRSPHISEIRLLADFFGVGLDFFGAEAQDETFELLSRARNVFLSDDLPHETKTKLYKEIMKMYLEAE